MTKTNDIAVHHSDRVAMKSIWMSLTAVLLVIVVMLFTPGWDEKVQYLAGLQGVSMGINFDFFPTAILSLLVHGYILCSMGYLIFKIHQLFRQVPRSYLRIHFISVCVLAACLLILFLFPSLASPGDYPARGPGVIQHLYGYRERVRERLDLQRLRSWAENSDDQEIPDWLVEQLGVDVQEIEMERRGRFLWLKVQNNRHQPGGFGILVDLQPEKSSEHSRRPPFKHTLPLASGVHVANTR